MKLSKMKTIKYYLFMLVCNSFIIQTGYGQQNEIDTTSSKEIEFIQWFFKKHNNWPFTSPNSDSIMLYYADKMYQPMLNEIKLELQKEITWDYSGNRPVDKAYFSLSEKEKDTIMKELDQMYWKTWEKKLLKNSNMLERKFIDYAFCNVFGQLYFFEKHPNGFYEFTKPIFLRNDTICIFYCGLNCGTLCSDDRLMIFKKEKGEWIEWLTVFRIIS